MVVIDLPAAADRAILHDRVARPSMRTVQAPHCAMPQPYLVPVSFSESRSTHSNGVSGSTSTLWAMPFYAPSPGLRKKMLCARPHHPGPHCYLKLDAVTAQGEVAVTMGAISLLNW